MNINLDYNGKHYNFNIPKNAKIDYLKELSCKLFKSDKTLLELICNNQKLDGKNDNIFIQDLIPKGKNSTVLTIQMGDDKKNENSENINISSQNKNEDYKKEKKQLKVENNDKYNTDIKNKNSNNLYKVPKLDISNINDVQIYENRIFISNYIRKSNELFALMKDFNDKVKEIDNKLNRKMKNYDIDINNNIFYYELSLFEKRLIDFQKAQINYYKELIQTLNINNDETKEPNFELLYNKILLNNNESFNEKNKNKKLKIFPSIENINFSSSKIFCKIYDQEQLNTILPMLKIVNKNELLIKDENKGKKEEDETVENKKISKLNKDIIEKYKIKNLKLNKLNLKTEIQNINCGFSDEKEIKYQIEDRNIKSKINRNNKRNYSKNNREK